MLLKQKITKLLLPQSKAAKVQADDTLFSVYKSKLEAARPEDEASGFWEDVESFTMHYPVEARAFVANGGADLAVGGGVTRLVAGGVTRDAKQKYADELDAVWGSGGTEEKKEKKKYADELDGFYEAGMEMGCEDNKTTVHMIVRAVDAALHMYSPATVAEFAASKGAAIAATAAKAAKKAATKAARRAGKRKAKATAATKAETAVDGSARKRQKK